MDAFGRLSWWIVILACATIGLAPFSPQPHIVEKLRWIFEGTKSLAPIDWFDVLLHGTPWVVLALKAYATLRARRAR